MSKQMLFFSHSPQLRWYGLIARDMRRRTGLRVVLWVLGQQDRHAGESTCAFDQVVDLLDGFTLDTAQRDYQRNLEFLARYEAGLGWICFREDAMIDRHLANRHWPDEFVVAYSTHLVRAMRARLEQDGIPVAAVGENNTLPYRLAHRLLAGIPYWNFTVVRPWESRFYLDHEQSEQWDECRELYREYCLHRVPEPLGGIARARLEELKTRRIQPVYFRRAARGVGPVRAKFSASRLTRAVREWLRERRERESASNPCIAPPAHITPIAKLRQTARQLSRARFFDSVAQTQVPGGDFAVYFLHVQPEYSVEGLAFDYRNQLALLQNVAGYLPAGWRLAVKEHKPMVGMREQSYYRDLLAIPNVILVSDRVNSHALIIKSKAVITLTGTAALEAMFHEVPVVIFGDVYFDQFEGIYKPACVRDLRGIFAHILEDRHPGAGTPAGVAALAAMYEASYPGKIGAAYTMEEMAEPANLSSLTEALIRKLEVRNSKVRGHKLAQQPLPPAQRTQLPVGSTLCEPWDKE